MAKFSSLMCLGLGVGIVTAAIGMLTSHPVEAAPGATNVIVTNTPLPVQAPNSNTIPLPVNMTNLPNTQNVSGTVNVGNFPAAQAMNITNPQTQPVPTFDAQNQPFGTGLNLFLGNGAIRDDATFAVPSGQRLIIEYISGNVCLPTGQKAIFSVEVWVGNNQVDYVLPALAEGTFDSLGCDNFVVSQLVRIYAEPNTTVDLGVLRSDSTGTAPSGLAVSGHLVNTQ